METNDPFNQPEGVWPRGSERGVGGGVGEPGVGEPPVGEPGVGQPGVGEPLVGEPAVAEGVGGERGVGEERRAETSSHLQEFDEAYARYVRALQEANAEAQARVEEAYRAYGENLQASYSKGDQLGCYEAALRYGEDWLREVSEARRRCGEAYRAYLTELQRAWGALDVDALHPYHLATIGNSLLAAASNASYG